ncbi:hypothetical protein D8676_26480 [Mesorhizobium sp. YM1C-6-2]|nr:hypothetical protein D8676_26480 [Mesorhizobium sp. YM1C-6-2]
MPVRKRVDRRRAEALPAWRMVFAAGYDYFDDLAKIGVPVDRYGRPALDEVRAAWSRLGDLFLAEYDGEGEPWAEERFGRPGG